MMNKLNSSESDDNNANVSKKYVNRTFNINVLLYVTLLLVLIYLTITAWDGLIDFLIIKSLNLREDDLSYHLVLVLVTTIILITYFYILGEDVRTLLGIELI